MQKILLTSNTSWSLLNFRGGFIKCLKEKGFKVTVVAPEDEFSDSLKKEFEFIPINKLDRKGVNPVKDFLLFVEYLQIFSKVKPDLIISYTIKPNIYSSLASRILKIPAFSVITGLGYVFIKETLITKIVKVLYKASLKKNRFIIFLNNEDLEVFKKIEILDTDKLILLNGEGVNPDYFTPSFNKNEIDNKKIVFLFLGRLLWDKGVGEFVEAGKIIKEKYPLTELWILGLLDEGNPSAIPKEKVDEWEREGIIKYLGSAHDIRPYMSKADCVVLPSYYREGLPRSLLEAMAMETPIITTDTVGCRDVCIHGTNGFLVPIKNTAALADAMEKFINLPFDKKREMGLNGRKLVLERFDEKIILKKYLDLIRIATSK